MARPCPGRDPADQKGQFGDLDRRRADPSAQRRSEQRAKSWRRSAMTVPTRLHPPRPGNGLRELQQVSRDLVLDPPKSDTQTKNQIVRRAGSLLTRSTNCRAVRTSTSPSAAARAVALRLRSSMTPISPATRPRVREPGRRPRWRRPPAGLRSRRY